MNVSTASAFVLNGWESASIVGALCVVVLVALYFAKGRGSTTALFSGFGFKSRIESKIPRAIELDGTKVIGKTVIRELTGGGVASTDMETGHLEITTQNAETQRPK